MLRVSTRQRCDLKASKLARKPDFSLALNRRPVTAGKDGNKVRGRALLKRETWICLENLNRAKP